jgi:hypothetical protein
MSSTIDENKMVDKTRREEPMDVMILNTTGLSHLSPFKWLYPKFIEAAAFPSNFI